MKKILLYLLPLLFFAACANDEDTVVNPGNEGETVKALFALKVTGVSDARTRSSLGVDTATIKNVWVLQFNAGTGALLGTPQYLDASTDLNTASMEVKMQAATSNIYFVANTCNSGVFNSLNCSTETKFKAFTKNFSSAAEIQSELINNIKLIPMTGILTNVSVSAAGNVSQTVNLVRTVALVDFTYAVAFPAGVNFDVKTIRVCNVPKIMYYVKPSYAQFEYYNNATDHYSYPLEDPVSSDVPTNTTKSGHLMFYLPDNLKGNGTSNLDPKLKNGINGAQCTYLEITGFTDDGRCGIYRFYLGNDDVQNYDVERNNVYTVSLTLKDLKTADSRISVYNVMPESNCYMVTPGENIMIPISRVNTAAVYRSAPAPITVGTTDYSLGLVWAETDTGFNPGSIVQSLSKDASQAYIVLKAGNTEGNAVIKAVVGTTIVWSWHIWVTNYNPNASPATNGNTSYFNSRTWMDRNLGAKIATVDGTNKSWGLLYQWGRKDPFPPASGVGSTTQSSVYDENATSITFGKVGGAAGLSTAIKNPFTFYGYNADPYDWYTGTVGGGDSSLWGNSSWTTPSAKTPYDPCPDGWRVPGYSGALTPWYGLVTTGLTFSYGWSWSTAGSYPAAGRIQDTTRAYFATETGATGSYWTASGNGNQAALMNFGSSSINTTGIWGRANALSVRCIKE